VAPKRAAGGGGYRQWLSCRDHGRGHAPASPSLLPFRSPIFASIKFTTSSGTSTTVNLNPALTVDLMRLQTDTVFLGLFPNIPAAQYVSATLFFSGNAKITFLNDTGATLSAARGAQPQVLSAP